MEHKTEAYVQQKTAEHKADKLKTPQSNAEKHEQQKPKIYKVDEQHGHTTNKQQQALEIHKQKERPEVNDKASTSKQDTIEFLGDIYSLVESPPHHHQPICHACTKHIKSSFYHCKAKGWDLHPSCSKLKTSYIDGVRTYNLVETNVYHYQRTCHRCKTKNKNSGLVYISARHDRWFHLYCFVEAMEENDKKNDESEGKGVVKGEAILEVLSIVDTAINVGLESTIPSFTDLIGWP